MPNHVTNVIEFNCSEEEFRRIAEFLRCEGEQLGSVDFNKLIPMPEELAVESGSRGEHGLRMYEKYLSETALITDESEKESLRKKYIEKCWDDPEIFQLGKAYFDNLLKYGATTWYDWCIEHWGTKWNAYDSVPVNPGEKRLQFCTAWNSVPNVILMLSKRFPDANIVYGWADEDVSFNVGTIAFRNGKPVIMDIPDNGSKEAYEMAAKIMDFDLSEWGYVLSEDGSTYEYNEENFFANHPEERTSEDAR